MCNSGFFFLKIRRPPRYTQSRSSAASDVDQGQGHAGGAGLARAGNERGTSVASFFRNEQHSTAVAPCPVLQMSLWCRRCRPTTDDVCLVLKMSLWCRRCLPTTTANEHVPDGAEAPDADKAVEPPNGGEAPSSCNTMLWRGVLRKVETPPNHAAFASGGARTKVCAGGATTT